MSLLQMNHVWIEAPDAANQVLCHFPLAEQLAQSGLFKLFQNYRLI
jgi:hypothetical protein